MKLLFLLYDFYPNFGANSLIINNLSRAFIEEGHEVHILPMNVYTDSDKEDVWNKIHIHRITQSFDKKQVQKYLQKFMIWSAIRLSISIFKDHFNEKEYQKNQWSYFSYKHFISILNQYEIDIVINVCYPFEACLPVINYLKTNKKLFKWIIYMQDPFATNSYYLDKYPKEDLLEFQTKAFQAADKIIVTASIMQEINTDISKISLNKFITLNFPKITRPSQIIATDDIRFSKSFINCVYVGKFNNNTRNPKVLFKLFEEFNDEYVRLHVIGEDREKWKAYLSEPVSNIFFYGTKSKEASMNAELNSNILINLGNSVTNQLPSKLLEYISTGKPIVNLYQMEGCPTLEFLAKYPICFNILESSLDFDKTIKKLRHFFYKYKNTTIKYYYIENKFYDCTVEYVSNKFLNLFNELIKDKEFV